MTDSRVENQAGRSWRPDGVTLSGGLLALAVSVYVLGGFEAVALQWLLSFAVMVVGVVMVAAAFRGGDRPSK